MKVKGKKKKNGKQKYETVLQTVTQEKKVNETIIGTCKDANLEHCGILEELSGSVVASAALHIVWALYSIGLALWAYIEHSKESKFSAGTMTKWSPELVLKEVYAK